ARPPATPRKSRSAGGCRPRRSAPPPPRTPRAGARARIGRRPRPGGREGPARSRSAQAPDLLGWPAPRPRHLVWVSIATRGALRRGGLDQVLDAEAVRPGGAGVPVARGAG